MMRVGFRKHPEPSHDRTQLPRHEFVLTVTVLFALGGVTAGGGQQLVKDDLTQLVDAQFAVDDLAAIDVDVVRLAPVQLGVGGQFQRWRRRTTIGRTATGGETNQVGTSRHLASGADRVIARRVHVHKPMFGHRLRVFVNSPQIGGAAFGDRAQGFLKNGGQTTVFVAR